MNKKGKTRLFEDILNKKITQIKEVGIVTIDDVLDIIKVYQDNEMDAHNVIAGQNGLGKSYVELSFMRKFYKNDKDVIRNLIMAKNTRNDIVIYLLTNEGTMAGIDELNQYLDYKSHAESTQRHLIASLELARANRIALLGCVRDPRHLDHNYRNGKMSVVIWIIDRFLEGGSYAGVFIANPSVEGYDRFGWSILDEYKLVNFDIIRAAFERVPSFVGWMKVDDLNKNLSKELLMAYKQEKRLSNAYAHANHTISDYNKRKLSDVELEVTIQKLSILDKKIEEYIRSNIKPKKT